MLLESKFRVAQHDSKLFEILKSLTTWIDIVEYID